MWLRHYSLDFMPHILTKVVQGNTALAADALRPLGCKMASISQTFFPAHTTITWPD